MLRQHGTDRTKPEKLLMSYAEFREWADEDVKAEWVDGEVIVHLPPKHVHQATVGFLFQLLGLFVNLLKLGRVRVAPFEMDLRPAGSAREPDLLFVAAEHLDRLTEDKLVGPADLVVEVISDDSVQRDRDRKWREYQRAGVREYWILDPRPGKERADFFRLDENGGYQLFATEDDERVESIVLPGFWLRPAWLWQVDALDPLALFCEMRGLSGEQIEQIVAMLRSAPADGE